MANLDFWMGEVQHRLQLIDGFVDRRRRIISGTQTVYADDIRRGRVGIGHDRSGFEMEDHLGVALRGR